MLDFDVSKPDRWLLLASLTLKTTCTETCAETLNCKQMVQLVCFSCVLVGCKTSSVHIATYCIGLCTYVTLLGHRTTLLMLRLTSQ